MVIPTTRQGSAVAGPPFPWVYGSMWSESHSWVPFQNVNGDGASQIDKSKNSVFRRWVFLVSFEFCACLVHSKKPRNKKGKKETKLLLALQQLQSKRLLLFAVPGAQVQRGGADPASQPSSAHTDAALGSLASSAQRHSRLPDAQQPPAHERSVAGERPRSLQLVACGRSPWPTSCSY